MTPQVFALEVLSYLNQEYDGNDNDDDDDDDDDDDRELKQLRRRRKREKKNNCFYDSEKKLLSTCITLFSTFF